MKYTILLVSFFVILLVFFPACQKTSSISPVLQEAETWMESNPDSSLSLLEAISYPEKLSKEEYATWCLLVTQARDKNYVEHTSDSVINIAVNYFEKIKDGSKYAKALYYKGRSLQDQNKIEEAMSNFVKTLDIVKDSNDYQLLFLISSRLGRIYANRNLVEQALKMYQQAFEYAVQSKDSSSISYAYSYLGRVYGLVKDWDQAKSSYSKAIEIAKNINDLSALKLSLNELISIYVRNRQFREAFICFQQIEEVVKYNDSNVTAEFYLSVGNLYRLYEIYDTAKVYLNKALNTTNLYASRDVYRCFYSIYEDEQNYKEAIKYNNLYLDCVDSTNRLDNQKAVLEISAKYENERLLNINNQLHWKQKKRMFVYGGLVLFLSIGFVCFVSRLREILRKKDKQVLALEREQVTYSEEIEENQKKIKLNESEIERLRLSLEDKEKCELEQQILMDENENLKRKNNDLLVKVDTGLKQIFLYKQASVFKNRTEAVKPSLDILIQLKEKAFYLDAERLNELLTVINLLFGNFSKRMQEKHPRLTSDDLKYCCLIKLDFSISDIAIILSVQDATVRQRKQRIKLHLDSLAIKNMENLEVYLKSF